MHTSKITSHYLLLANIQHDDEGGGGEEGRI